MKRWARGPLLPVLSVGLLVAALCALLLRGKKPRTSDCLRPTSDHPPTGSEEVWTTDTAEPRTSRPVPQTLLPDQKPAPCNVPPEVEINGGCWIRVYATPPCPTGMYAHENACFIVVRKASRLPVSSHSE